MYLGKHLGVDAPLGVCQLYYVICSKHILPAQLWTADIFLIMSDSQWMSIAFTKLDSGFAWNRHQSYHMYVEHAEYLDFVHSL